MIGGHLWGDPIGVGLEVEQHDQTTKDPCCDNGKKGTKFHGVYKVTVKKVFGIFLHIDKVLGVMVFKIDCPCKTGG